MKDDARLDGLPDSSWCTCDATILTKKDQTHDFWISTEARGLPTLLKVGADDMLVHIVIPQQYHTLLWQWCDKRTWSWR